jgi:hypothetical protein
MRQTEDEYDWTPEAEIRTGAQARPPSGGALDSGADLELNGNLPGAYEVYDRALGRSPDDQALRVAAGRRCGKTAPGYAPLGAVKTSVGRRKRLPHQARGTDAFVCRPRSLI